ncbi:MAG: methyltransferase domain-containing protein [Candidatus Paceibacterota bacterium]
MNWKSYIQNTKNRPPSLLLGEAISHAHKGMALDIGAGNLVDSKEMVNNGFRVMVVDPNVEPIPSEGIEIFSIKIEDFDFPLERFALVNAQYSLPFTENIPRTVQNIHTSLIQGGIFSGQFFGKEDGWNGREGVITHARAEIENLFSQWEIIRFEEEKKIKSSKTHGEKLWHVFHVIARKK